MGRLPAAYGKSVSFRRRLPAQRTFQCSRVQQTLDMIHPNVTATLQIFPGKADRAVGIIEFLGTFASGPLRLEIRQHAAYLFAADTVAAFVGTSSRGVLNATTRNDFGNDICQFRNAIVLIGSPNVEGLVVNDVLGELRALPARPR